MRKRTSLDFEEWTVKWAEGTLLGFAQGNIELNRAVGMLQRAISYIGKKKLAAIIETIEKGPIYLPYLKKEEKIKKFKLIKKVLKL